jgi:sugar lactone lactonase YvrE
MQMIALVLAASCSGRTGEPPETLPRTEPPVEEAPARKQEAATGPKDKDILLEGLGFSTPESVLYDKDRDRYLVSNINGPPTERDGNGFISVVEPTGKLAALKWIDGASDGTGLDAPKGMAILDGKLYVADIDQVRVFSASTGKPQYDLPIEGASFLNDVAADGSQIYVSDSGLDPSFNPSGTDAVYRIYKEGKHELVVADPGLGRPNGLATRGQKIYLVGFGGNDLRILGPDGSILSTEPLPAGSLDGIALRPDGSALVSSWEGSAVYLRTSDGVVSTVLEGVNAPADIGWDSKRNRLLVPMFKDDKIWIRPLGHHNASH